MSVIRMTCHTTLISSLAEFSYNGKAAKLHPTNGKYEIVIRGWFEKNLPFPIELA